MFSLEKIIIFALALNALLVLWFHPDSLLVKLRARTELWDNVFGRMLGCRLCMSYQIPFWLMAIPFWAVDAFLREPWRSLAMVPIHTLAIATMFLMVGGMLRLLWSSVRVKWCPDMEGYQFTFVREFLDREAPTNSIQGETNAPPATPAEPFEPAGTPNHYLPSDAILTGGDCQGTKPYSRPGLAGRSDSASA